MSRTFFKILDWLFSVDGTQEYKVPPLCSGLVRDMYAPIYIVNGLMMMMETIGGDGWMDGWMEDDDDGVGAGARQSNNTV